MSFHVTTVASKRRFNVALSFDVQPVQQSCNKLFDKLFDKRKHLSSTAILLRQRLSVHGEILQLFGSGGVSSHCNIHHQHLVIVCHVSPAAIPQILLWDPSYACKLNMRALGYEGGRAKSSQERSAEIEHSRRMACSRDIDMSQTQAPARMCVL